MNQERIDELKKSFEDENVSYGEIAEIERAAADLNIVQTDEMLTLDVLLEIEARLSIDLKTTQQVADEIFEHYQAIMELAGGDKPSVMVHGLNNLHLLDDSWKVTPTLSNSRLYMVAGKEGVSLFSGESVTLPNRDPNETA